MIRAEKTKFYEIFVPCNQSENLKNFQKLPTFSTR